jgi:hypothetical protein
MEKRRGPKNKRIVLGVVLLLIIGAAIGYFVMQKDTPATSTPETEAFQYDPPGACDVLALEDAQEAIGPQAVKPEESSNPGASSDDIEVTQCIYQTPATSVDAIKSQKSVNILVRGAKTDNGAKSNRDVFLGPLKPEGVVDVDGYGEAAFWNPQFGQLNILKSDNWYILSVGPINPTEKKLEDAKNLAEQIQENL